MHHPLNYSQGSNDGTALRNRMLKYLLPVTALSLLFNITKFFEATYKYEETETGDGVKAVPVITATPLRQDPRYSIFFNWFRFISIGLFPFGLLVLFNAKIYVALRQRKKRTKFRRAQSVQSQGN